jgi:hypothetical protein
MPEVIAQRLLGLLDDLIGRLEQCLSAPEGFYPTGLTESVPLAAQYLTQIGMAPDGKLLLDDFNRLVLGAGFDLLLTDDAARSPDSVEWLREKFGPFPHPAVDPVDPGSLRDIRIQALRGGLHSLTCRLRTIRRLVEECLSAGTLAGPVSLSSAGCGQAESIPGEGEGAGNPEETIGPASPDVTERPKLTPSREKAIRQYNDAVDKNPAQLNGATDLEVYDWLKEHAEGEQLPSFATWARYLREARDYYDAHKYTPKAGRSTGKSVVRRDQVE